VVVPKMSRPVPPSGSEATTTCSCEAPCQAAPADTSNATSSARSVQPLSDNSDALADPSGP
jgi:hypothetical protein